jgi:hypothetical protein
MRLRPIAILTLITTLLAAPGLAGDKPLVVVELFTSQGCSSCPPADALIEELAARDDVLPLALHVDYWDYIGWADSFARPQYTARQKAYAHMAHSGSIYTPQMVVGGVEQVVGFKPMTVADLVQAHGSAPVPVEVRVERDDDGGLRIRCLPRPGAELPAAINVDLVGYLSEASVEIHHGENAGKTITYANIVQSWDRLGTWDGRGVFDATLPRPGDGPLAVIVQVSGPGRVLAAIRVP